MKFRVHLSRGNGNERWVTEKGKSPLSVNEQSSYQSSLAVLKNWQRNANISELKPLPEMRKD